MIASAGLDTHGGFGETIIARADFVHPIPEGFSDLQAAPLLCGGIIGYRTLKESSFAGSAVLRIE